MFDNPVLASAALDRLRHHATINIKGESSRSKEKRRAGLLAKKSRGQPEEEKAA